MLKRKYVEPEEIKRVDEVSGVGVSKG